MRFLPLRSAWRVGLAVLCATAIWAFCVNRMLNLTEGFWKELAIAAVAVVLAALVLPPARSSARPPRLWPWLLVLLSFGLGEARRLWLRNAYRVEAASSADIFSPLTTTALRVTRFTLRVPGLPVERLRVVQVSDVHVTDSLPREYPAEVLQTIRGLEPDLLLLTGDYLSRAERMPLLAEWLKDLPSARYGTFGVLGNHDYWTGQAQRVGELLRTAGVSVLSGDCQDVALTPQRALALCGTEAPWGPALAPARLKAAQSGAAATLVLSHTPDNVYALAELGATVVFAGHTHGGQIRVPGLGAIIVPSRYGRRFDQGHFLVDGSHLFVSAGVGADAPPIRLWCPPELVVVELLPAAQPE